MLTLSRKHNIIVKGTLEVIPQVYQLSIRGTNIILIVEEELTLVDTGFRGSSVKIADFIQRLGRSTEEISLIILTHNHLDHVGGLAELRRFTPAKIAAHKADFGDTESQLPYSKLTLRLMRVPPISLFRPLEYIKPGEVDFWLEGGEVFKPLGGLKVIHTPGHTPGSISLFSLQKKLLMVGDAINNRHKNPRLPPKMVSTNLRQATDSVKGLAQLDFDSICFGHGRPLTTNARTKVQELVNKTKN